LDSKTGISIMRLLRRSCDELKQTVIVVSHDPRASAYADRVIFLRDGAILREYKPGTETPINEKLHGIMSIMEELES
jgi:putative ABC transport system ATP-binding protein